MATNYVQEGEALNLIAPYEVSSGGGALVGATFGVAQSNLANAEEGVFDVEGVYTLAKATGASTGGSQGARAYWNNTNKNVTAVSTSNTLIGVFTATCADGDATCVVRLNGSF
jgi:predicted RecA/RadA family phage recombinase